MATNMDVVYSMPDQHSRLFINVVHACPNKCIFCVDFKGRTFYGYDLKNGQCPSPEEIVSAVEGYEHKERISEIYYCGIGEPLLLYETVIETVDKIRELFPQRTIMAINTSGTFYLYHPRVDFARKFDLIQVSLNAENEKKYNMICQPKVKGAYRALMNFLHDLRVFIDENHIPCRVELSVVDTSEINHLPEPAKLLSTVPAPDIEACQRIASELGWPLKVKKLLQDCADDSWIVRGGPQRLHSTDQGRSYTGRTSRSIPGSSKPDSIPEEEARWRGEK